MKHFKDLVMVNKKIIKIDAQVNKHGVKRNESVKAIVNFRWQPSDCEQLIGYCIELPEIHTIVTRHDEDDHDWKLAEKIAVSISCKKALDKVRRFVENLAKPYQGYLDRIDKAIDKEDKFIYEN